MWQIGYFAVMNVMPHLSLPEEGGDLTTFPSTPGVKLLDQIAPVKEYKYCKI